MASDRSTNLRVLYEQMRALLAQVASIDPEAADRPGRPGSGISVLIRHFNSLLQRARTLLEDDSDALQAIDQVPPVKEIQERLAASYHKKAKHEITAGLNLVMQALGSRLTQPATSTTAPSSEDPASKAWDVFICHASEDKEDVVELLAEALRARGLRVWYDRWVLNIGDSLRRKIDEGLSSSRYGIVILSKAFLGKKAWTERELDGLVQREISGKKVILPVWHRVTREEVARYSTPLADKLAGSTEAGIDQLADELVRAIAEDLPDPPPSVPG